MERKCKECNKSIEDKKIEQIFCSRSCNATHNNRKRIVSDETRNKQKISAGIATKGRFKKNISSILELSTRTVQKILVRLNVGCSNCGWDKTTCDIHHINGRKIDDCDNHNNLSLLCPNCHRLTHEGKLDSNDLKTLNETIPNNWKDFYYG